MATVTPNFNFPVPQSTDLVKDGATAIAALGTSIDTQFVDLKGGTTGQVLAKASATDLDYSWTTPQVGDITAVTASSPITGGGTSGDVTVGILDATTSNKGAVQLSTSISSTSTSLAATASAVKSAYDLAASKGSTLISSTAFTGATSVAIDSVFTSNYPNYRIEIVTTSGSGGAAEIQMRLRTSGTANSNALYQNSGSSFSYAGTTENANASAGTTAFVFRTNGATWVGELNLYNPQASQLTWWLGQYADTVQSGYRGGYFNATTSFDGIQLTNSGGTNIAGTIRIYGMAN